MFREKIIPKEELEHLGDLLSYYLVQRDLAKPVPFLQQIIKDLRRVIIRMISSYFTPLPRHQESWFIYEIVDALSYTRNEIVEEGIDEDYCDYCINQIIASFERAVEIKYSSRKEIDQKELLFNSPILQGFDLKLRPFIKLLPDEQLQAL